ncbi:MAG TPA: FtsX-like permease family protein [Acidimicrobiales bacterium]|nr:FtsX-like permease family protein [Acidimicrobiales bacterium]
MRAVVNVTVKGVLAQKRRLAATFLAVFLGIAFLSGTLVLGDTLRANFDALFAESGAGTDAVVRAAATIEASGGMGPDLDERATAPLSLADRLRALPGVAAAEPSIEGYGRLIGRDGKAVGGNGPPRLAGNWVTDPELNPYRLVAGRAPEADDEVVVNRGAAEAGALRVGDTTIVQTPEPVRVTVVGIATFGTEDGFGAVTFTAFTLAGARLHVADQPSSILVRAADGVDQEELAARLRPLVGEGNEVLTGEQFTAESTDQIGRQFLDFFTTFLTVFAGVALLVATFSIYNTFSILVAQRSRESALLRALGAVRGQIVASVAVEALLVGLLASAAGLLGGVVIAGLLKGLFDSFGFSLPAGGLVFQPSTAVVSLGVGAVVTLVAGLWPAVKASRVAPVAALRESAAEAVRPSRARAVAGAALTGAGVAVVLASLDTLAVAGPGTVLTMVGVVVLGPVVARPAARVLGWPLSRLRGVTGTLAGENAVRNPRRMSGTAAALMVGVGVVTLFTVFAASTRASIDESVSRSFGGDLVVSTGSFGGGGLSPALAGELEALPEVGTAVGLGQAVAAVDGEGQRVTVVDTASLFRVLDLDVRQGSIERLGPIRLAVSQDEAEARGWSMGAPVPVRSVDGTTTTFTVGAVYRAGDVAGSYLVDREAWPSDLDTQILVALAPGTSLGEGKSAVTRVTEAGGGASVLDREEYVASAAQGVDMMLGIVYVLLFLAIVIALMGIANTLSLSIHERTRELGLLRAVGQTRAQLRSMVRWESVVVALFGTLGGVGLGVFLGWALVQAASAQGPASFAAPAGQLLVVVAAGAVAGVLAGVRPARRAARLDVLAAIASA